MHIDQPVKKENQEPQQVQTEAKPELQKPLTYEEQMARDIAKWEEKIDYSSRYYDNEHEYRHVILPRNIAQYLPRDKLLSEPEWRSYGVRQSEGWEHYMIHAPEPHILLFRRERDYQSKYPEGKPQQ